MSLTWRGYSSGEWNLQHSSSAGDRINICKPIRLKTGRQLLYHATVYLNAVEHDEQLQYIKQDIPMEVIDVCRSLIDNHHELWYND
jgi:hypothetical protein